MTNPLMDMPCFALYAASRAVSQAYRAVLADEDITYPQFLVVVALHAERESTVSDLAATMFLDSGTLSPLLKRLEARNILTRTRKRDDERTVVVALTPEGELLHARVTASASCLTPAYGIHDMGELTDLLASLHRITAGMSGLTADVRATSSR